MADLQRNINVNPTIASVGSPSTGPSTAAADLVQGLGSVVRDFAIKKKQDQVEKDLEILGDEVFAAKMGKQVKEAGDRFERLRMKKEQGLLTEDMVRIETEAVLKQSIEQMPGFAPELRRFAADKLGYDPTGEQLRQKLAIPKPSQEDPLVSKARSIHNALLANGGETPAFEDILSVLGTAQLRQAESEIITAQASIGARDRRSILNATIQESNGKYADTIVSVLDQIQTGGVKQPGVVKSLVTTMASQHKRELLRRYSAAGINPDSTHMSADMAAIDALWEPLVRMADDGSLEGILESNKKNIASALTIEGYNLFGDMFLINQAGGQEGVKNYLTYVEKYKSPEQLALLRKVNPELGRLMEGVSDMRPLAAEAYKKVMGIEPGFNTGQTKPQFTDEQVDAAADDALYNLATNNNLTDPEKTNRATYAIAQSEGKKWKILGAYMQKGARRNATDIEIKHVKNIFEEEYEPLMARIAAMEVFKTSSDTTDNTRGITYDLQVKNGQLVVVQNRGDNDQRPLSGIQTAILPTALVGDIKRLNAFSQGINNGWAQDLEQDPSNFMANTVSRIRQLQAGTASQQEIEDAISAFERDNSPENLERLRQVAPEVVDRAMRFTSGSRSNSNAQ